MDHIKSREFLSEIDHEIAAIEKRREKLVELRRAVIEFAGEDSIEGYFPAIDRATEQRNIKPLNHDRAVDPLGGVGGRQAGEQLSRWEVVSQLLRESGRPMKVGDMIDSLWEMGRDLEYVDRRNQLFNTLTSSIIRSNKFTRVGRGTWWFLDQPIPEE